MKLIDVLAFISRPKESISGEEPSKLYSKISKNLNKAVDDQFYNHSEFLENYFLEDREEDRAYKAALTAMLVSANERDLIQLWLGRKVEDDLSVRAALWQLIAYPFWKAWYNIFPNDEILVKHKVYEHELIEKVIKENSSTN